MLTLHEGLQELEREFSEARVSTDRLGFYEQGPFVRREQKVPDYFNNYARFVQWQPYSDAYLDKAEQIIHVVVAEMQLILKYSGSLNAYEETPAVMMRMLERAGVWCFVARGAMKIAFPPQSGYDPFTLCAADLRNGSKIECGHQWVVAPPFQVIDLAILSLDYPCPCTHLLPKAIVRRDAEDSVAEAEEILGPAARAEIAKAGLSPMEGLERYLPDYPGRFADDFPAQRFMHGEVEFKYVPTKVVAPEAALEQFEAFASNGRSASQIFDQSIKPRLAEI